MFPFLPPENTKKPTLKIPEKLWFSGVFMGHKMGILTTNVLTTIILVDVFVKDI